jgi:hypothetical protein
MFKPSYEQAENLARLMKGMACSADILFEAIRDYVTDEWRIHSHRMSGRPACWKYCSVVGKSTTLLQK